MNNMRYELKGKTRAKILFIFLMIFTGILYAEDIPVPDAFDMPWQKSPLVGEWRKKTFSKVYPYQRKDGKVLQEMINKAISEKAKVLTIPSAIYEIGIGKGHSKDLVIENAEDLVINAENVVLLCYRKSKALTISNCRNFSLKGLIIDYAVETMPFTQAVITSKNGIAMEANICEGYRIPSPGDHESHKMEVYSAKSLFLKAGGRTRYGVAYSAKPDGTVIINKNIKHFEIGDIVTIIMKSSPHGLSISNTANCTLENVTIHTAPMFAILARKNHNTVFRKIRITPGPIPDGATMPRVLSGCQDGINMSGVMGDKVVVEDCLIESHSDDAVAIYKSACFALKSKGRSLYLVASYGRMPFEVGQTIELIDWDTQKPKGRRTIKNVEKVTTEDLNAELSQINERFDVSPWARKTFKAPFYNVTLNESLEVKAQDLLTNETYKARPIIRNNIFRNHRARGLHLKLSGAVITNNMFEHCVNKGICFGTDLYFAGSANAENILIKGNTFRHMFHLMNGTWDSKCGIISFFNGHKGKVNPPGAFKNIKIVDNIFEDVRSIPFMVTSTEGLEIVNNKIIRSHMRANSHGKEYAVDQGAALYMSNVSKAYIDNNTIIDPGPFLKKDKLIMSVDSTAEVEKAFELKYTTRNSRKDL
ncbi:MAG: right-handed parallel beta-helix repeat-containing protein [Planctomycetes bacterium]|nr:right-handed parallel beta-helix repeat-containing protein [Planctomycetota bacterium]